MKASEKTVGGTARGQATITEQLYIWASGKAGINTVTGRSTGKTEKLGMKAK